MLTSGPSFSMASTTAAESPRTLVLVLAAFVLEEGSCLLPTAASPIDDPVSPRPSTLSAGFTELEEDAFNYIYVRVN